MGNFKNDGVLVQEYVYDFAKDGGAVGTLTLSSKAGAELLPAGAQVKSVIARVLTACTSGGSATVSWGNEADVDGYSGTAIAVASLTANSSFNGAETAGGEGALIFSRIATTPAIGIAKPYSVTSTANTQNFQLVIATAALTAGKIGFSVEYVLHSGN